MNLKEAYESASIYDKAAKKAFPDANKKVLSIIASWYEAEDAADDCEGVDDLARVMERDIGDMLDAATDEDEIAIITAYLREGDPDFRNDESKKNEDDAAEDIFEERKDKAAERLGHLESIIDSFQPTEKGADQAKISIMDYILMSLDNVISDVEKKLGLKKE